MSEVKAVARYLLPGPTFKGISPSFGQVRSYDEYSEEHVKETKGYWLEGEKLYREADYEALAARLNSLEQFQPTPTQVNALPEGVRVYVASLQTLCDPAGNVAENTLLRDQTKQLDAMIGRLKLCLVEAEKLLRKADMRPTSNTAKVPDGWWNQRAELLLSLPRTSIFTEEKKNQ